MKRILTTIQKRANKILSIAILAGAITSCDSILNYNEDCDIEYCVKSSMTTIWKKRMYSQNK